jgi:predicted nucleic acid-binding protein
MVVADSSVWIDYFRPKTPSAVKVEIEGLVAHEGMALTEPVVFETLRAAPPSQRLRICSVFDTYPVLPTLPSLWLDAVRLGQMCADRGFQVPGMDLLVAQTCLHHHAELVTFDRHYECIAQVSTLKLRLLKRAE